MSATLYNSDICEYTQADTNRCSFFIIMYQIKNIVIIFFLMLVPVGVTAQYQKAQEKAPLVNVPLENFASQQKVLFNFGWKFQLVTNDITISLTRMTLPGVHWTFLMISSSNNPGLKMVEVHADSNLCVKDGIASLSLPIRRGKGNG